MLIILIAHIPGNHWTLWIPARFGFSDATEMFVFQSGMASALAFGATFDRAGALGLTARVAQRIWQIFWAHVGVFVVTLGILAAAGTRGDGMSYLATLNLGPFIGDPGGLTAALLTLRYVPNYFDILPMYMVVLALMPVMLLAERAHRLLPFLLIAGLWLAEQFGLAGLPAEPWSERTWFFGPFGWQLLFFTGFFLRRGTLPHPGFDWRLMALAVAVVLASVPFAWVQFFAPRPAFRAVAEAIGFLTSKSHFGALRLLHFLALCYIAVHLVGPQGSRLRGPVVRVLTVVGQQSLAVFIAGMVIAQVIGIALDAAGRNPFTEAVANLGGFGVLIAAAYLVRWFKGAPWKA